MSAFISKPKYKAILVTSGLFALYAHFAFDLSLKLALDWAPSGSWVEEFAFGISLSYFLVFIFPVFLPGVVVGLIARSSGFMHGVIIGTISLCVIAFIPGSLLPAIGSLPSGSEAAYIFILGVNGIAGLIGEYLALGYSRLRKGDAHHPPQTTSKNDQWLKITFRCLIIASTFQFIFTTENTCPNLEAGIDYVGNGELFAILEAQNLYVSVILIPVGVLYMASIIGLFFFESWARPLAAASGLAISPAMSYLFDSVIFCATQDAIYTLSSIALGAVLALAYSPPLSKYFQKPMTAASAL